MIYLGQSNGARVVKQSDINQNIRKIEDDEKSEESQPYPSSFDV